ncbi:MAG: LruC domain-containing protein [Bacteroidales bacterium]|nr:LruC domain-containing protein [Bacteroidales bacterium]
MWGYDTQGGIRSFEAPDDFHGDIYGNYIAYDYYVGNTAEPKSMQANTGDIRITDGNKVLSVDFMATMPHQVNGGWQTLYIKLDETATQGTGWRIGGMNTYTTGTGNNTLGNSAATTAEIQSILQNVTGVLIAPEGQVGSYYGNGFGPEFIGVDNVGVYESLNEITIIEQGDDPSDTDGDGVADELDAYPDDPDRAFNNYTPSENSYATLAYEDLWPSKGDYDFNDLVIDYRFNQITNADNLVVDLEASFVVQAIGAGFQNGFAFQLPVTPSMIQSVQGQVLESGYFSLSNNGTEAGQSKAVIPVFENS